MPSLLFRSSQKVSGPVHPTFRRKIILPKRSVFEVACGGTSYVPQSICGCLRSLYLRCGLLLGRECLYIIAIWDTYISIHKELEIIFVWYLSFILYIVEAPSVALLFSSSEWGWSSSLSSGPEVKSSMMLPVGRSPFVQSPSNASLIPGM